MNSHEKVSVAIVALEKADSLIDLIASIMPQLSENDEIVIVVEQPVPGVASDMTREVAFEIARQVPLVRVLTNEKRGRGAGYELAIRSCTGEVVFLAEPGDVWKPEKVSTVLSTLSASGTTLILHDAELYAPNQNNRSFPSLFSVFGAKGELNEKQIRDSYVGSCIAFRMPLSQFFLPFPEGILLYDQWMGLVAEKYGGVALLTKPLITKSVGDGTDNLSTMVSIGDRHNEQRKLLKTLKRRQKELNLVLQQLRSRNNQPE